MNNSSKISYPKILFITVNGWNNTTGTSTISSIIEDYPKECIANIFIRSDMPNSKVCDNYFQINEFSVIKSIFRPKIKTGKKVSLLDNEENNSFNNDRKKQNFLKKHRNLLTPYIRDFVWKLGRWKSQELIYFVKEFNPDIIIFPAEGMIHFNNIGLFLAKITGSKIGVFFWDDNFTYKSLSNRFAYLYRYFLRRNIKKIADMADISFAIAPKTIRECSEELGIVPRLITKPMHIQNNVDTYIGHNRKIKILYTGNLYIGRGKTILELIKAIKTINSKGDYFFLDLYTNSELTEEERAQYNINGVSQIHDAVDREKVYELQNKADILLFVEALSGKYVNSARLSFSTKLVDYFSAKRCILAIGPKDIAPMEYLADNDISIIVNTYDEILEKLESIKNNRNLLNIYAAKAYEFGVNNHSKQIVYKNFLYGINSI